MSRRMSCDRCPMGTEYQYTIKDYTHWLRIEAPEVPK